MKRLTLVTLALVASGCGKDPTVVPVRNLERPSDMSFVCMRTVIQGGVTMLSGRPMFNCQSHLAYSAVNEAQEEVDFAKPRKTGTFGLIANSSRGELAVVDMDLSRLVDLDPAQPGYNMLPLGRFPEVIAASQNGCMVVSANRGSCDLTVVDPQRLLRGAFGERAVSTGDGPLTRRVVPTTGSGVPLQVAPQEIAFLPTPVQPDPPQNSEFTPAPEAPLTLKEGDKACQDGDKARVVVTFPSCDLVAVIELPSGRILSSMYVRPDGLVDAGTEPVCPADCGIGVAPQPGPDAAPGADAMSLPPPPDAAPPLAVDASLPASDAAAGDGAASGTAGDAAPTADGGATMPAPAPAVPPKGPFRIGALAIRPEGKRLYVGGFSAEFLTAIDLADGMLMGPPYVLKAPPSGGRILLHEGPGGVSRLRLSVDPFAVVETRVGRFLGKDGEFKKYLYAFSRDNSVRVLNVGVEDSQGLPREHECDVNIDPRAAGGVVACGELSDDPNQPLVRRRPFAQGPGLRIPSIFNPDDPPPVPQDIAFAQFRAPDKENDYNSGGFGYLVASDGEVYVLNVGSLFPTGQNEPPIADNTFRNDNQSPLGAPGGARVIAPPARILSTTDVPLPVRLNYPQAADGMRIEGVADKMVTSTLVANLSWVKFPDPTVASSQGWLVTWEGALPGTVQDKGVVLPPAGGLAGVLVDQGQEFCQAGALPGDVVLFAGCSQDKDCSVDGTSICRQALPGTPGLCFPVALAKDPKVLQDCGRILVSRRRYEVASSSSRQLNLRLKPDENPKPALAHCTTDADCTHAPYEKFRCLRLRDNEPMRCVQPCDSAGQADDQQCRPGNICAQIPDTLTGPLCVEGPELTPACWPMGARYQVQAGKSFVVTGTLEPRPPVARQEGDTCVPDDSRNPLLVNRIPLEAPHCVGIDDTDPLNTVNLTTSQIPSGPPGTWGNPCLFWGVNDDDPVCYHNATGVRNDPVACNCAIREDGSRSEKCHVKALFQNSQVQFVMTNLEQYMGDANINRFEVVAGFAPERVRFRDDIVLSMGVRIVTGPTPAPASVNIPGYIPYIFVIDQGRTSPSGGGRGQVLRFNPRAGTYGYPQFDSNYNLYPFQIQ